MTLHAVTARSVVGRPTQILVILLSLLSAPAPDADGHRQQEQQQQPKRGRTAPRSLEGMIALHLPTTRFWPPAPKDGTVRRRLQTLPAESEKRT